MAAFPRWSVGTINVSQASKVITNTIAASEIQAADAEHPRAGYVPWWAV